MLSRLWLFVALPLWGQPAFDVASMKVAPADQPNVLHQSGGPGTSSPGVWTASNAGLKYLIYFAWELDPSQVSGPPAMDSAPHYDISAKLPPGTTPHDFHLMIQRMLTERLGLVVHHETRQQDGYDMVIAKGGPKLTSAEPALPDHPEKTALQFDKNGIPHLTAGVSEATIVNSRGIMHMLGRVQTTAQMAHSFSARGAASLPIVDQTGLTGVYDYDVPYALDMPGVPPQIELSTPLAYFPESLERTLGLKLIPRKMARDVIVIDRFNPAPTEN